MTANYWEPHTSSVDFCEPNYHLTPYVVEVHNVWSSLFITVLGLVGLLCGNPTKEYSIAVMFLILVTIGIGSAILHATLHWLPQSSDEVPMLWQALSFLHLLYVVEIADRKIAYSFMVGAAFTILAILQTFLYFQYQNIYAVFICSIILYSIIIVIQSYRLVAIAKTKQAKDLRWFLWKSAFLCYVVFGAGLWIIDMNLCRLLLPLYSKYFYGCTLHVFWHIFAGLGTYLISTCMVAVRLDQSGCPVSLGWKYCLPIICQNDKHEKRQIHHD